MLCKSVRLLVREAGNSKPPYSVLPSVESSAKIPSPVILPLYEPLPPVAEFSIITLPLFISQL